MRARAHIMRAHDDAAGGAATRYLLERDSIGERVEASAAQRLGHADAHQAQLAHLADLHATEHLTTHWLHTIHTNITRSYSVFEVWIWYVDPLLQSISPMEKRFTITKHWLILEPMNLKRRCDTREFPFAYFKT